jgi:CRISPR-associated protein (Cas_APE2256)
MKKIITTVGTSLFTNYMRKEVRESADFREDNGGYAPIDKEFESLEKVGYPIPNGSDTDFRNLTTIISRDWLNKNRPDASAEISSLHKIAGDEKVEVYLLATETALSVAACRLIRDYLKSEHNKAQDKFDKVYFVEGEHIIEGLQVKDAARFKSVGLQKLIERIKKINESGDAVLNISGGYKALIPVMTVMGQLYDMDVKYLYEDSEKLIEVGSLPIDYDWHKVEEYYDFLNFEGIGVHQDINKFPQIRDQMVSEKVIEKIGTTDKYQKTILGTMLSEFATEKLPTALEVMGFYVELKILEYYSKKKYISKDSKEFLFPSLREKEEINHLMAHIENPKTPINPASGKHVVNREIDLFVFSNPKDQRTTFQHMEGEFVTFECKPLRKFKDAVIQSYGQLLNFKKNPKEHCILVYNEKDFKSTEEQNLNFIRQQLSNSISYNDEMVNDVKLAFKEKGIALRLFFCPIVRNQVIKKGMPSKRKSSEYLDFISKTITIKEYENF